MRRKSDVRSIRAAPAPGAMATRIAAPMPAQSVRWYARAMARSFTIAEFDDRGAASHRGGEGPGHAVLQLLVECGEERFGR